MKIIFFGASQLGYVVCRHILENKLADVVALFTVPETFKISYAPTGVRIYNYASFETLADEFSIPLVLVENGMSSYLERVREFQPDLLMAVGWYHMMPKSMRELAPKGCIGIHASLLPKYRGGAPLVWAMINGESKSGISLFYFEDGVDEGDIIAQKAFDIAPSDTIKEVLGYATDSSIELVAQFLPKLASGSAPRNPQNHSDATLFPQRSPKDGLIDWSWDKKRINDFIRAQTKPYPGAYTIIDGKKVTIWTAEIEDL